MLYFLFFYIYNKENVSDSINEQIIPKALENNMKCGDLNMLRAMKKERTRAINTILKNNEYKFNNNFSLWYRNTYEHVIALVNLKN